MFNSSTTTAKMPPLLLLSLILILPFSAASSLPLNHFHFSRTRRHSNAAPEPQEFIEVTRPLPFDSLTPSCTLPVLSHSFAHTLDLPPVNVTYFAPLNCTWTNAVLQFSGASNGSQYDRIAGVWLAGAELLRTSTPEPTEDGIFWKFQKDVTRYSSLLRQSNITLAVMLENIVNDWYTGIYRVNITFSYYDVPSNVTANNASSLVRKSTMIRKLKYSPLSTAVNVTKSLELDENPADLIIPISAAGEEGFWFKIKGELDAVYQGIQIPNNTYRAVIEVYASFHGDDEFWYSNPPDFYIETNNLPTKRGHGAYREVLVKLDNNVVGSVIPFPVIFTGGINPEFWDPVVAIGAFSLPTYEFEITPFLGILLDRKVHYFGLGVADALPFWLVNANLHLWLDDEAEEVQAGPIKYSDEDTSVEREYRFQLLDGKFEIEGEGERSFSGWVNSSAGNFTTYVTSKVEFENTIRFKDNGTYKSVKHEGQMKNKIEIKSSSGSSIQQVEVERKYPLKLKMTYLPGSGEDNTLVSTELKISVEEEKKMGNFKSKLENTQKASGWMFVHEQEVLSGSGTTEQTYQVKDSSGCYTRKISADAGVIDSDSENFLCAVSPL